MLRKSLIAIVLVVVAGSVMAPAAELAVSANQRYLLKDGKPFFYLCDSGWDLFMRPNLAEANEYLENRADKGFNVIMSILIGWLPHRDDRNAYGEPPLIDKDPARPNEKYFQHVDQIVNKANSLGMFVAIVPAWSDWMYDNVGQGPHPFNVSNARSFGEYVGRRYRDNDIIWVMGGDRNPQGYEDIIRAMVAGLDAGDGDRDFLMTFHGVKIKVPKPPQVYYERLCSASLFGGEAWLDFHGAYSGHQWAYPTYEIIARDRAIQPIRPVIDLEPCYENHAYIADGTSYWANPAKWDGQTRGTAALIRAQAYWAMLAGAAGHTYAGDDVWQFHDPRNQLGEPAFHANTHWRVAMDFPGAFQMGIMRRLFESRPWQTLEPDQSTVVAGQGPGENHIQGARASDGKSLLVYLPRGGNVTVAMEKVSGNMAKVHWFNPRAGTATPVGEFPRSAARRFSAPSAGAEQDWLLVVDDAAQAFGTPGGRLETESEGSANRTD